MRCANRRGGFIVGSLIIVVIVLTVYGVLEIIYPMSNLVNVEYNTVAAINLKTGNEEIPVSTITTTLFTTLMTINLALIALAVTAYVFLIGALNSRDIFEKEAIDLLISDRTKHLIVLSAFTGLSVVSCLFVDNAVPDVFKIDCVQHVIILMSVMDIVFLLAFIFQIIDYENNICSFAEKNIKKIEKQIVDYGKAKAKNGDLYEEENKIIKDIGDLEILIDSVLTNHEVEYRYPQHKQEMLKAIFDAKIKDSPEKNKEMCILYFDLLKVRDSYLCVRKKSKNRSRCWRFIGVEIRAQKEIILDYEKINKIQKAIDIFLEYIKGGILKGEKFIDQNFSGINFAGNKKEKAQLSDVSFRMAAISNSQFDYTDLSAADFSNVVFRDVSMKDVNCQNTLFVGAKFYDFKISEDSVFTGAVFNEVDFNSEKIGGFQKKCDFESSSFNRANMVKCKLENVLLEKSVFKESLLSLAIIEKCCFNYGDFTDAILADSTLIDNFFNYANLERIVGIHSLWKICEAEGARMAKANFTEARFEGCRFNRIYAEGSTFSGSVLKESFFKNAVFDAVDFSCDEIENCHFDGSNMKNMIFTGNKTCSDTTFIDVDFSGSQMKDIIFYNCKFDKAIFNNVMLKHVVFENCSFHNAQFYSTFIMDVKWKRCYNLNSLRKFKKKIDFATKEDYQRFVRNIIRSKCGFN